MISIRAIRSLARRDIGIPRIGKIFINRTIDRLFRKWGKRRNELKCLICRYRRNECCNRNTIRQIRAERQQSRISREGFLEVSNFDVRKDLFSRARCEFRYRYVSGSIVSRADLDGELEKRLKTNWYWIANASRENSNSTALRRLSEYLGNTVVSLNFIWFVGDFLCSRRILSIHRDFISMRYHCNNRLHKERRQTPKLFLFEQLSINPYH